MHEAGLARAIAEAIRSGDPALHVRLVVSGGAGDPTAFDDALRLHLAALLPDVEVEAIPILHRCAEGSPGELSLALPAPERIDVVWERPGVGD